MSEFQQFPVFDSIELRLFWWTSSHSSINMARLMARSHAPLCQILYLGLETAARDD